MGLDLFLGVVVKTLSLDLAKIRGIVGALRVMERSHVFAAL
jgi:hypothetical protein